MTYVDLDEINAPVRPDFRRVGRHAVPLILDPTTGKHVQYRRTSSAGKVLDDESGLNDWKMRTVLVGAAYRPELLAVVSTLDPEADKKTIRDYVEECVIAGKGQSRQIQGTAVHSMFDHVDLGHDWEPAPNFRPLVDAYRKVLDTYGLMPIDVEVQCVNDHYRLAGTLDRRYRTTKLLIAPDGAPVPIGSVLVGDTKTGRTLEYAIGTYACQMAGYVDSVRYDVTTDERSRFDPPSFRDWGLIIHAVPETATVEVYWCDISAGRDGLQLAFEVWQWRRRTDLLTLAAPGVRVLATAAPPTVPATPALTPVEARTEAAPRPTAEAPRIAVRRQWMRERVRIALGVPEAARDLQAAWPIGVPGLKYGGHTTEQLDALESVLHAVEIRYLLPVTARVVALEEWARHNRFESVTRWIRDIDQTNEPLMQALCAFGNVSGDFDDEALDIMLRATLNTMQVEDIGDLDTSHVSALLQAAFAMQTGTAVIVYDEAGNPRLISNAQRKGLD